MTDKTKNVPVYKSPAGKVQNDVPKVKHSPVPPPPKGSKMDTQHRNKSQTSKSNKTEELVLPKVTYSPPPSPPKKK